MSRGGGGHIPPMHWINERHSSPHACLVRLGKGLNGAMSHNTSSKLAKRCNGFVGQAPLLEFTQKGTRVGDLEGEKVTERQILEAAHEAARELGLPLGLFTGVPRRLEREAPRYDFLVETADLPDAEIARRFLHTFDQELAKLNFLWRTRRKEGVLAPPHLWRLQAGRWEQYISAEVARVGTGDYQYKHPGIVLKEQWIDQFQPVDVITLS